MANRNIFIHPQKQFNFKPNSEFREKWNFLPNRERAIAKQLTFLEFHWWLYLNLRHSTEVNPAMDDMRRIAFDVADGFRRSDILLFGGICETAIYCVLKELYEEDNEDLPSKVEECFEVNEKKGIKLPNKKFKVKVLGGAGRIC